MTQADGVPDAPYRDASKPDIREALRKAYRDAGGNPPNVNEAWALLKGELPHARRRRVREVLAEAEFARQRREPGKRRCAGPWAKPLAQWPECS
jgi:hypothetical protein